MSDIRKTDQKQLRMITLRLHEEEVAKLKALATANFRTQSEQLRAMIDAEHRSWMSESKVRA